MSCFDIYAFTIHEIKDNNKINNDRNVKWNNEIDKIRNAKYNK